MFHVQNIGSNSIAEKVIGYFFEQKSKKRNLKYLMSPFFFSLTLARTLHISPTNDAKDITIVTKREADKDSKFVIRTLIMGANNLDSNEKLEIITDSKPTIKRVRSWKVEQLAKNDLYPNTKRNKNSTEVARERMVPKNVDDIDAEYVYYENEKNDDHENCDFDTPKYKSDSKHHSTDHEVVVIPRSSKEEKLVYVPVKEDAMIEKKIIHPGDTETKSVTVKKVSPAIEVVKHEKDMGINELNDEITKMDTLISKLNH